MVEKVKIINSSDNLANEGFISIKNTTDTNQKAWRKKQLVYKLGKTDNVKEYITDIVVLTKYKNPPEGFMYLGELEKMHVCYKLTSAKKSEIIDFTQQIENLRIQSNLYPNMVSIFFSIRCLRFNSTTHLDASYNSFIAYSLFFFFFINVTENRLITATTIQNIIMNH